MISIGAVFHGRELMGSSIQRAIMTAAKAAKELRGSLNEGESPWVNAVFEVSGSLGQANYDGQQYGEYSGATKGLVVKIAVPRAVAESKEGGAEFVVGALRGANAMAFEYFRQKGDTFALREAEELVSKIASRLRAAA